MLEQDIEERLKFRGKSTENGKWFYSEDGELHLFFYGVDDGQIDRKTVGQCQGRKDVNGQPFYEHDIIDGVGDTIVLVWDMENSQWSVADISDLKPCVDFNLWLHDHPISKIIGNIHEELKLSL